MAEILFPLAGFATVFSIGSRFYFGNDSQVALRTLTVPPANLHLVLECQRSLGTTTTIGFSVSLLKMSRGSISIVIRLLAGPLFCECSSIMMKRHRCIT